MRATSVASCLTSAAALDYTLCASSGGEWARLVAVAGEAILRDGVLLSVRLVCERMHNQVLVEVTDLVLIRCGPCDGFFRETCPPPEAT